MGCNCGKRKTLTAASRPKVLLTMPDGAVSEHGSKLEAQAENARRGGGGRVTTKQG